MKTRILNAFLETHSPTNIDTPINANAIDEAARLLTSGDLVAIPTETVYGLAANALNANAVKKIYAAKGRPANNPLIVHVENATQARTLTADWPTNAELLATAFWPGPLTLVLNKKQKLIPDETTAGGETVAIRCPRHPIALELIRRCGFPLAAPSANRSNALSPTTAAHVYESLGGRIPLILDGGPCTAGIESTVLDLTSAQPQVLRPGVLSANFLSEILQCKVLDFAPTKSQPGETHSPKLSPGQMPVHYAPKTPLSLVQTKDMPSAIAHHGKKSKLIAIMTMDKSNTPAQHPISDLNSEIEIIEVIMPPTPKEYAQYLYATLHELDARHPDHIICELPPQSPEWLAINDRLFRAAHTWP